MKVSELVKTTFTRHWPELTIGAAAIYFAAMCLLFGLNWFDRGNFLSALG
jgi:hypothetical protein